MTKMTIGNLSNVDTVLELAQFANESTGEMFFSVILLTFFVISFVALSRFRKVEAFAASSFTTTILAVLFWVGGLVGWNQLILAVIATIVGGFLLFIS